MADDPNAPKPVPMFDQNGTLRDVPFENMMDARQHGFKPAVSMTFSSGVPRYVPADKLMEASQKGGKVNPIEDQPSNHPAWYSHVLSDTWNTVKGVMNAGPEGGSLDNLQAEADYQQKLKSEGHGLPYRLLMSLTPDSMRDRAESGDMGGVASATGAMVAPVIAGAKSGLVGEDYSGPGFDQHPGPITEHPLVKTLMDNMSPKQLHQGLNDLIDNYVNPKYNAPGTVRHGMPKPGGGWGQLWTDESGEFKQTVHTVKITPEMRQKFSSEAPISGKVNDAKLPQTGNTVGSAEGAARDTSTLAQVQKDHPEWSLSQQLQEAAKRVNPKKPSMKPQELDDYDSENYVNELSEKEGQKVPIGDGTFLKMHHTYDSKYRPITVVEAPFGAGNLAEPWKFAGHLEPSKVLAQYKFENLR